MTNREKRRERQFLTQGKRAYTSRRLTTPGERQAKIKTATEVRAVNRTFKDMVKEGIITKSEARKNMRRIGFRMRSPIRFRIRDNPLFYPFSKLGKR